MSDIKTGLDEEQDDLFKLYHDFDPKFDTDMREIHPKLGLLRQVLKKNSQNTTDCDQLMFMVDREVQFDRIQTRMKRRRVQFQKTKSASARLFFYK